nr:hypothetical protein [Tanacetum cinerariifolium]
MSSACNNFKLDSQDVISKVVCAVCKKCLNSVNHDKCLRIYVNGKIPRGKKQTAKVSVKEIQKNYQPNIAKPKKIGTRKSIATPKPSKSRFILRWSPTGRLFDQDGKISDSSESESQSDCFNGCSKHMTGNLISTMAFEQCSSKPGLQSMTSGQISSRLDLTYAPSTITKQQPTEGDIRFFIRYSADSCAYRIYNCRTNKIMETMNVSFDELSAMAFEQRSLKLGLQSMISRQISSELDLTYAPSTIMKQQPTEGELDLLFETMYDDYFGGQPSATVENVPPAQEPQVRQTSTASTTIADNVPIPTNSSTHATNILVTSQDVDELNPNAMID